VGAWELILTSGKCVEYSIAVEVSRCQVVAITVMPTNISGVTPGRCGREIAGTPLTLADPICGLTR